MDQEKQKEIYTGNIQTKYLIVQIFKTAFQYFSKPIIIRPSEFRKKKRNMK